MERSKSKFTMSLGGFPECIEFREEPAMSLLFDIAGALERIVLSPVGEPTKLCSCHSPNFVDFDLGGYLLISKLLDAIV